MSCPFCGADDTLLVMVRSAMKPPESIQHAVQCLNCNCHGPLRDTQEAASDAWRSRVLGNVEPLPDPPRQAEKASGFSGVLMQDFDLKLAKLNLPELLAILPEDSCILVHREDYQSFGKAVVELLDAHSLPTFLNILNMNLAAFRFRDPTGKVTQIQINPGRVRGTLFVQDVASVVNFVGVTGREQYYSVLT